MSTESERNDKALQLSVEEYRQLWEVLRGLEQDRRYIWTFLTAALLGLPAAAAALAGKEGLDILRDDYAHSIAGFLTVLWLVGLCGFIHLIRLRAQQVEYTREVNRIRGFWGSPHVERLQPSKWLLTSDDQPHFCNFTGGSTWFAASIAVMVSFVFSLSVLSWARCPSIAAAVVAFAAFLTALLLVYAGWLRAMERSYDRWRKAHGADV